MTGGRYHALVRPVDFVVKLLTRPMPPIGPVYSGNDNPEALRPKWKTWIDGLRKAGLDIPDEPATDD